jgi:hypothetical protein
LFLQTAFVPTKSRFLINNDKFLLSSIKPTIASELPQSIQVQLPVNGITQSIRLYQIQGLMNNVPYANNKVYKMNAEKIEQISAKNLVIFLNKKN